MALSKLNKDKFFGLNFNFKQKLLNALKVKEHTNPNCSGNTVEKDDKCIACIGGSNVLYKGVQANIAGCNCPDGTGWDIINNRCVICPMGMSSYNNGGIGGQHPTITGCGCFREYKYNSSTKQCEACPVGTVGTMSSVKFGPEGCYCEQPMMYAMTGTNECVLCNDAKFNKVVNNKGECVSCPSNSASLYTDLGNKTGDLNCWCSNGYVYKDGACVACPADSITSNGKCCPEGSSYYSSGSKVADECYCIDYHTLQDNKCVFTPVKTYTGSISLDPVFVSYYDTPYTFLVNEGTIGTTLSKGYSSLNAIVIEQSNSFNHFIKDIVLTYVTPTDTTVKTYKLPNIRDVFIRDSSEFNDGDIVDIIDGTWIVKRITFKLALDKMYNDITDGFSKLKFYLFADYNDLYKIPMKRGVLYMTIPSTDALCTVAVDLY